MSDLAQAVVDEERTPYGAADDLLVATARLLAKDYLEERGISS